MGRKDTMQTFRYTIQDEIGIHARPASMLRREAGQFSSAITMEVNGNTANAKRMMQLMRLDAHCGDQITVYVDGEDETEAVQAMLEAFSENL